jgi:hypothetical protein
MFSNGRSLIDLRLKQLKYTGIKTWSVYIIIDLFLIFYVFIYLFIYICIYYLLTFLLT